MSVRTNTLTPRMLTPPHIPHSSTHTARARLCMIYVSVKVLITLKAISYFDSMIVLFKDVLDFALYSSKPNNNQRNVDKRHSRNSIQSFFFIRSEKSARSLSKQDTWVTPQIRSISNKLIGICKIDCCYQ